MGLYWNLRRKHGKEEERPHTDVRRELSFAETEQTVFASHFAIIERGNVFNT